MRSRIRTLALAGEALLFAATLLAAGGCSLLVRRTDTALRAEARDVALHFPDPTKYLQCVKAPKGRCDAESPPASGPAALALFRAWSAGRGNACTVGEAASGAAFMGMVADAARRGGGRPAQELEHTNALALRGLSAGISPPPEMSLEDKERLSANSSIVPGSEAAARALAGEIAQQFHDYYWAILAVPREGRQGNTLRLTAEGVREFAQAIQKASANEAWEPLYFCGLSRMRAAEMRLGARDLDVSARLQVEREMNAITAVADGARFAGAYVKAYFRSGQFFDFIVDPAKVEESLAQELIRTLKLGEAEAKALAKRLLDELPVGSAGADGKAHLLTKLSGGLVTRGGKKIAFPDVDVTFTPLAASPIAVSKIDLSAVGADVVRVFIEAVGDSIAEVPGDTQSTGCNTKDGMGNPLLECFDPKTHKVTAENFATINARANSVDSMVGNAVGSAVRGVSWFSLNNEALAKAIETAAAVAARKATEKVVWCYYACGGPATKEGSLGVPWEREITIPLVSRR